MNRQRDRLRRTHTSVESSQALKGRELRSFRPFPASAEPSPLEHSLGEIALMPATAAPAPVFQANPNRAEIVPDNPVPGMTIQAKLMIGAPGGKFEQEADRVATQVVRQIQEPEPRASVREQAVHREEIQGKDHQVESRPMSVNAPSGVTTRSAPPHLEPSIHQSRGGGQPLPNPIRVPMEQAFGADFSGVRIHADTGSDELASSIQAEAFTTGRDVYFRQGAYEPRSRGGQKLLAHELTDVVQQLPHDQKHLEDDQSSAESIPRDLVDQGGSGQPLPEPIQKKMESFFNTSFADVRVHVGHEAPSIGALAFTHGTDVYFAPGQYNPQSTQGQQLLGHELTHVLQQRSGRVRNPLGTGVAVVQDPALEAEAERVGLRAATAALPIQAKPAGTGPAVAPLPAAGPRPNTVAASGAILPARSPAHDSVQRKAGPILPGKPSAPCTTVPDTFSTSYRFTAVQRRTLTRGKLNVAGETHPKEDGPERQDEKLYAAAYGLSYETEDELMYVPFPLWPTTRGDPEWLQVEHALYFCQEFCKELSRVALIRDDSYPTSKFPTKSAHWSEKVTEVKDVLINTANRLSKYFLKPARDAQKESDPKILGVWKQISNAVAYISQMSNYDNLPEVPAGPAKDFTEVTPPDISVSGKMETDVLKIRKDYAAIFGLPVRSGDDIRRHRSRDMYKAMAYAEKPTLWKIGNAHYGDMITRDVPRETSEYALMSEQEFQQGLAEWKNRARGSPVSADTPFDPDLRTRLANKLAMHTHALADW